MTSLLQKHDSQIRPADRAYDQYWTVDSLARAMDLTPSELELALQESAWVPLVSDGSAALIGTGLIDTPDGVRRVRMYREPADGRSLRELMDVAAALNQVSPMGPRMVVAVLNGGGL